MAENYYSNESLWGDYQFVSLTTIIDQFMVSYVGENKIIKKAKVSDVSFHAHRALQELSFDTFKSVKSQEVTVPNTLYIPLPQDYVNYTKISWVDSSGIKHRLYPTLCKTGNPKRINEVDGKYFDSEYQYENYYIEAKGTVTINSDQLVLDGEYKNIMIGMRIKSADSIWGINGNTVNSVSTSGGVTTVTMSADSLATGTATQIPVEFRMNDGSTILPVNNFNIINVGQIDLSSNYISLYNTTDGSVDPNVSNLKPGDFIDNEYYPSGTQIDEIIWDESNSSGYITTTNPPTATFPSTASSTAVTFYTRDLVESSTWAGYKGAKPSESQDDYIDDTYWPNVGERYGLDPQHAQSNGSFFIDNGKIYFSSNISGETVVLDYISDGVGTNKEMKVHKFAEEAMYKWIAHAILSTTMNIPEYLVARFKKERFAETRKAKLRLSNLKIEELTQILRGKSKQIKH